MENFILSLIVFIIIYLFYLIFVIIRPKKREKFKKNSYVSVLVNKYHVDLSSINFIGFINVIALSNAFIVSGSFYIMNLFSNMYVGFIFAIVALVILEILMYKLIGFLYGKKEK